MFYRLLATGSLAAILLLPAGPSNAQTKIDTTSFTQSQSRVKPVAVRGGGLDSIGYVVGDGIVIAPSIQTEAGHDDNPDRLFDGPGSAYGRVDGGVTIGIVNPQMATTLSLKGGFVRYDELARDDRFDAGASLDTFFRFGPGQEITAGAFYLRDEISFTKSEVVGSYAEYAYTGADIEGFSQSRYSNVRYINGQNIVPLLPLFQNSAFDVEKFEQQGALLAGRRSIIGAYVRAGIASVDYTDQRAEAIIDRDAIDYWGVAGLRFTFSPWLRLDAGVRSNYRKLEDPTIKSANATGFDGALTWAPSERFLMKLGVENRLGEPSTTLGRVADILEYSGRMQWRPFARTMLSMRAAQKSSVELGQGLTFVERTVGGEATYDLTRGAQLYLASYYERTSIKETEAEYDRFRIGVGARVQLKRDTFEPVPDEVFAASQIDPWGVRQNRLIISAGYSAFFLPEIRMTKRTDAFVTKTVGEVVDHDGNVDGFRVDLRYRDLGAWQSREGIFATFGVNGFYAHYSKSDNSTCEVDLRPNGLDCLYFNVVDPGAGDSNTGPFGQFSTSTDRSVHYWGASVDAFIGRGRMIGGLKDDPVPVFEPSPFKIGLGFRALQQKNKLFAVDTSVPDPVDYKEDLDTYYYGSFVGYQRRFQLGHGFSFSVSAEGGLYYTDTSYDADYLAFIPVGPNNFVTDRGSLKLQRDDWSFIGSLDLNLMRTVSWGSLGLYGEVEYLSKVPRIAYRDQELDGGFPFDITGPNSKTVIDMDDAWNYTVGAKVNVNLTR